MDGTCPPDPLAAETERMEIQESGLLVGESIGPCIAVGAIMPLTIDYLERRNWEHCMFRTITL